MLFFGLSLVSGVIAILVAQKLDIECQNAGRRQNPRSGRLPSASSSASNRNDRSETARLIGGNRSPWLNNPELPA
jgi:hypothetical protein